MLRLLPLLLAACDPPADTADDLQWYVTCGDPVCSGYSGPWEGVPACGDVSAGDPCAEPGAECDFESECDARLVCAVEDPTQQPGGCPISRRRHKQAVRYLTEAERAAAADEVARTRLATWRYTWEPEGHKPHLGFLIDDQPGSAAVAADGEHVDLYGYTSLAIAAIQAQQAEIEALRAEVAALREKVGE
jgi:hypothetical protein